MYYSVTQHILYLITDVQVFIKAQIDLTKKSIDTSKEINYTPGFCQEVLDIKIFKTPEMLTHDKDFKFLFSSNDNNLNYHDTHTNQSRIFEGHSDFIMSIDIKQNFIATGSRDGTVRLWEYSNENNNFECKSVCKFTGKIK